MSLSFEKYGPPGSFGLQQIIVEKMSRVAEYFILQIKKETL